jgi:hypothetical protein
VLCTLQVADFLFDVWDANCMEEFKLIDSFEARACEAFLAEGEEYSLQQKVGDPVLIPPMGLPCIEAAIS